MKKLYQEVFNWLGIGILITFISAYFGTFFMTTVFQNKGLSAILLIITLIIGIVLSAKGLGYDKKTTSIIYILYTVLTGFTFSSIFLVYKLTSIIMVFLITGILMFLMSFLSTKLSDSILKFKYVPVYLLTGSLITLILNIFLKLPILTVILDIVLFFGFLMFIIYDVKKIIKTAEVDEGNSSRGVYFAYILYLDFINIFIRLLRYFGNSKKE